MQVSLAKLTKTEQIGRFNFQSSQIARIPGFKQKLHLTSGVCSSPHPTPSFPVAGKQNSLKVRRPWRPWRAGVKGWKLFRLRIIKGSRDILLFHGPSIQVERNSLKRPGHGLDPFRLPVGKKVPLNHKLGERYTLTESVQTPQIWKSASPSRSHSPESTILMCYAWRQKIKVARQSLGKLSLILMLL